MIIGLAGPIESGKDTVCKMIQEMYPEMQWQNKKFATKIKQIASILLNIPIEDFEKREIKSLVLGPEWDNMTVRVFLQKLGTDAMRNGLHRNVWVNSLFADNVKDESGNYQNWIITDVRFINECEIIKKNDGIIVSINRPTIVTEQTHISENELNGYPGFDHLLDNTNSLIELRENVKIFMDDILQYRLLKDYRKLKFTIPVGNLSKKETEDMIRKLKKSYHEPLDINYSFGDVIIKGDGHIPHDRDIWFPPSADFK